MRRLAACLLASALTGLATGSAPAQEPVSRADVGVAQRTTAGEFPGTWAYASRDEQFALWFRERAGRIEMRVGFASTFNSEAFETDWLGDAQYDFGSTGKGTVSIRLTETSTDGLRGTWDWRLVTAGTTRSQKGTFTIYRALDGRSLVVDFAEWEWRVTDERGERKAAPKRALQFTKVSKRLALWDELPF